MEYKNIAEGIFLERPNRFVAHILIDKDELVVHVKNTGRCRELLVKGARVLLEESNNPVRKTKYSLVAVYKNDMLVNMDSQIPNAVAAEALAKGMIPEIGIPDYIKREYTYGKSRFDIYYEKDGKKGFIEVKGVTLENDGIVSFPDAPTQRGRKHLEELIKAKNEGYMAWILFVVQMKGIRLFRPNSGHDPEFAKLLAKAQKAGVGILAYDCIVTETSIVLDEKVPIEIE
ncbi:MAG: DNA/RNA nuclease SfsA [Firmicutes bacterium]|nr:DNA/RNA nuclease SfsA [Bacillota bacterium]